MTEILFVKNVTLFTMKTKSVIFNAFCIKLIHWFNFLRNCPFDQSMNRNILCTATVPERWRSELFSIVLFGTCERIIVLSDCIVTVAFIFVIFVIFVKHIELNNISRKRAI